MANGNNEDVQTNEDVQVETAGNYLAGKRIALCVSGGIAAIETPKIARMLRRYGADVKAYVTGEAGKFIGIAALEWGTGKEVVSTLTGRAEHICQEDLVLVAPATLNTIDKIFAGIADNPVTTLTASALGKKVPVYLAPTMHETLYRNPFLSANLLKAGEYGMHIIPPRISEGKAKMPRLETIVAKVARELSSDPIKGKRILVTGGPTPVKIDNVRRITNRFRGSMGIAISNELYLRGADVKLLTAKCGNQPPEYIDKALHDDYEEYRSNVFTELAKGYDAGIFSAAVADYMPTSTYPGKIKSDGELKSIPLTTTRKVISDVREKYPELFMVTFKYEEGITKEELLQIASKRSRLYQLVVANRDIDMRDEHQAYIIDNTGEIANPKTRKDIARTLVDLLGARL